MDNLSVSERETEIFISSILLWMDRSSQWSSLMIWRGATTWVNLQCWLQTQCPRPPFCGACCCLAVLQNGLVPINWMRLANTWGGGTLKKPRKTKQNYNQIWLHLILIILKMYIVWQKKQPTHEVPTPQIKIWATHLGSPLSPFKTSILCQDSQNIFHLNLRNTVRRAHGSQLFTFPEIAQILMYKTGPFWN